MTKPPPRNRNARPEDRPERPRPTGRRPPAPAGGFERRSAGYESDGAVWIWGLHAVAAALANPKRRARRLLVTRNAAVKLGLDPEALAAPGRLVEPDAIDEALPPGAVHQGAAVLCVPPEPVDMEDVAEGAGPVVILDQLTDAQNIGAVFRSAAAFGFKAVVLQTRKSPPLGGPIAKAAAGAIDLVPEARVVNLSRAIDRLVDAGWTVIGLDGAAQTDIRTAVAGAERIAIVLGAEGAGLRQGVAGACTLTARIPIAPGMESLNVSNAAAIAFYESARRVWDNPAAAD